MRESTAELLAECERLHGHICPGQVLGVRMAVGGCAAIGIKDPRGADRKKTIVWVEIDRCLADAISAVTGARLGRRSLKYVDYGKVAATFLNTETGESVRLVAVDDSRDVADRLYPKIAEKKERQMRAYMEMPFEQLFKSARVAVKYGEYDAPGRPRKRTRCALCGEGVNDGREVMVNGRALCRPCTGTSYYDYEAFPSVT